MTLHSIIDTVAVAYGVPPGLLRSKSQEQRYTRARHVACYVANQHGYSLPQIGRAMGGRHHTTILHSVREVARELRSNPNLEALVLKLLGETAQETIAKRDRMAWLPEDFAKERVA